MTDNKDTEEQASETPAPTFGGKQILKLVIEMGPLVVFFVMNSRTDIFTATAAFMVAIVIALPASWWLMRRLPTMPLITAVFVLVFGGLTLYLNDELFIKLKPTIVNVMFGAILLGGLASGRSFLKVVFADVFHLTPEGWRQLTFRWGLFFLLLAVLNEIVWRNFSTDTWVNFKVFGIVPLTMIFGMMQIGLLTRFEAKPGDSE
ncbi:Intracellular septation protein IspA [hydrothermal vent metagenome]|uniref:Intracellular septation protein IspA n=1 Tax=hydrothermal vent metagenome TaxID=652676 RepID=A0A3B0T875_9ZZZZ